MSYLITGVVAVVGVVGTIAAVKLSDKHTRKRVLTTLTIANNVVDDYINSKIKLRKDEWFTQINDNIILGAIPLNNLDHLNSLKKLGVKTVISVIEEFERDETIGIKPVSTEEWNKNSVQNYIFSVEDFSGIPVKKLNEIVDLINEKVGDGNKIYIHCKSGIGRSALVTICFLFKYSEKKFNNIYETMLYVKSKRNKIYLNSDQMNTLYKFEADLK
jgi:protein-tyrosine phosphatase